TIVPDERAELEAHGVEKVYGPEDGMELGLKGMIQDVFKRIRAWHKPDFNPADCATDAPATVGRTISMLELAGEGDAAVDGWIGGGRTMPLPNPAPVIGLTGTGGSGKSSLTDELLNRFKAAFPDLDIAVLAVDPTRRRTGGALLGDRIRMNSLSNS